MRNRLACLAVALAVPAFAETTLFDQSQLGDTSRELGGNVQASSGVIVLNDKWQYLTKPRLRSPRPANFALSSSKGSLLLVPDAENFTFRFEVADTAYPMVSFRWRDQDENYRLDFKQGSLLKRMRGQDKVLAQFKAPLQAWNSCELTVKNGAFQVKVDGRTVMECVDPKPLAVGAIVIGASQVEAGQRVQFGDLSIVALPASTPTGRPKAAGDLREAVWTTMERLPRDPGKNQFRRRQEALEFLRTLAPPVSPEVATALAVAQCDPDIAIQLAAQRATKALKLNLDVPALLLDGLGSDDAIVRRGAVAGLINLKLPPEQLRAEVVDALLKQDRRFARQDVKRLLENGGPPLQTAVLAEIQDRYAKAKDARTKAILLRALGRDEEDETILPGSLPFLAQALGDNSPEIRLAALKVLRWLDSPRAWVVGQTKWTSVFRDNPEIVKSVAGILEKDGSVECRIEAAGCLAEMRQRPDLLMAALEDKEPGVRATAADGLCNFGRAQIRSAVPALKKLAATATLAYIENEPTPPAAPGPVTRENALAETTRRVDAAAKVAVAMQAEQMPFPYNILAQCSAQLCLGRNRAANNERIQQALHLLSYGDNQGLGAPIYPVVYALHYSQSRYFPGGLTPETEAMFKESMFSLVDWSSKAFFDDCLKDVMKLPGTENQSLTYRFGLWFQYLGFLNEDPAYARRKLRGGKTVAEYYAASNDFMKNWLRTRALNGLWIELGSGYSGKYSLPAIFAFYVTATDPETRQLAKMFIDLALIEDAQASFGDVRGGSRSRVKDQRIGGSFGGFHQFLYEGKTGAAKGAHQLVVSGYRAPAVAVLLWNFEQYPPQPIEIANRLLGETREPQAPPADAPADDDDAQEDVIPSRYIAESSMVNYIWKTRHYMLGSALRHPRTMVGALFQQRQWNGLVFADGTGIFPFSCWYYSFQHRNVMILQREPSAREDIYIVLSPKLDKAEENGWVFINAGNAFAAIKMVEGGYKWDESHLIPAKQTAPIIIQAGDVDEFGSFANFKTAVQKNPITVTKDKVEYRGIEFFAPATGQMPRVDGKPFSRDPKLVYSSPFMQRKEGEAVVTVQAGDRRAVYNFATNEIHTEEKKQ